MIRRLPAFAFIIISVVALDVEAAPFAADRIPSTARGVMHIDLAAAKRSTVGRAMLETAINEETSRQLDRVKLLFSVDIRHDIDGLTIYSTSPDPADGVLMLTGRFRQDHLIGLVRTLDSYTHQTHGERIVHGWQDEGTGFRQHGVFIDEGTLLIGRRLANVKQALDTWDGRAENLSGSDADALLCTKSLTAANTLIGLSADFRGLELPENPMAAAADGVERLTLQIAESAAGHLTVMGQMTCVSSDQSIEVEQILRGLMLLGAFRFQVEQPKLADLLRSVRIRTAGADVSMLLSVPADAVAALISARGHASTRD